MIANFDAFELLGLPQRLVLDEEELKAAYHQRSSNLHPDQHPDQNVDGDFARLVQAKQILASPGKRLQHLLELRLGESAPDGRGTLGAELMDRFGKVANCLSAADAVIGKRERAQSALARALTENEAAMAREALERNQAELRAEIGKQLELFPKFDADGVEAHLTGAAECSRNLAFLEKWQVQLKDRFAKLF